PFHELSSRRFRLLLPNEEQFLPLASELGGATCLRQIFRPKVLMLPGALRAPGVMGLEDYLSPALPVQTKYAALDGRRETAEGGPRFHRAASRGGRVRWELPRAQHRCVVAGW